MWKNIRYINEYFFSRMWKNIRYINEYFSVVFTSETIKIGRYSGSSDCVAFTCCLLVPSSDEITQRIQFQLKKNQWLEVGFCEKKLGRCSYQIGDIDYKTVWHQSGTLYYPRPRGYFNSVTLLENYPLSNLTPGMARQRFESVYRRLVTIGEQLWLLPGCSWHTKRYVNHYCIIKGARGLDGKQDTEPVSTVVRPDNNREQGLGSSSPVALCRRICTYGAVQVYININVQYKATLPLPSYINGNSYYPSNEARTAQKKTGENIVYI